MSSETASPGTSLTQRKKLHTLNLSNNQQAQSVYNQDFTGIEWQSAAFLATYRDFVGHFKNYNRVLLFKMRKRGGRILTESEKKKKAKAEEQNKRYFSPMEFCGVNMGFAAYENGTPTVDVVKAHDEKLHLKGLASCACIWRCPVCSLKILKGRAESIYAISKEHERKGRLSGFVTLTVPHKREQPLKDVLNGLTEDYKKLQRQRFFKEFSKTSYLGQIKSVEITWKYLNGWHPHLHIMYFYKDGFDSDQVQEFQRQLLEKWCALTGGKLEAQDQQVCYGEKGAAEYISKWDASKELTADQMKRGSGISPFGILKKLALEDYSTKKQEQILWSLYSEYIEATKGKHRISFGKKLKEEYAREIDDSTDEELCHKIEVKEILAQIHLPVWQQISRKDLQPHLVNAYLMNGMDGLCDLLMLKKIEFDVQVKDNIPQFI